MTPPLLAAFQAGRADRLHVPSALAARGFSLRSASAQDLPFLRQLYGEARAAEMDAVAWPAQARDQFLDSQFALQHAHYLSFFADADFLLLERAGEVLGRLYLQRHAPSFLIIDITLLRSLHGQGIGSALIAEIQQRASDHACAVQLHVHLHNTRAARLYRKLGFEPQAIEGAHQLMEWLGPASV